VATLTNEQKISIITGRSATGNTTTWTALNNKDGVTGPNGQFYVSGFGEPSALTMTWNKSLFASQWKAVGREYYLMGYNLINGPVSSPLGRVPHGGRVPESFSPEPYLNGIAMGRAVAGMQDAGVIAAGRHFLLNEQETNRMNGGYSANADDKTTREVYLWPFADGVRAGMMAVMCAMNRVNGTLACENNSLLSGYLKSDLGFPGMVFPDVGSQSTAYGSANAGLDYGSSSLWSETTIEAGIANGSLTQARLDDMAVRNVMGYYFVGLDDGEQPSKAGTFDYRDVRSDHASLIRQVGRESMVLLKNENKGDGLGLPLSKPRAISLFGAHAGPAIAGPNRALGVGGTPSDVYQGHLASCGGSGQASLPYLVTPFQAISARAIDDGSMIWWIMNDSELPTYRTTNVRWVLTSLTLTAYSDTSSTGGGMGGGGMPGMSGNGTGMGGNGTDMPSGSAPPALQRRENLGSVGSGTASSPSLSGYASHSDVCLVFLNADSGEGADRSSLSNTDQDTLVTTVASECNNTIVVLNVAGPRVLSAWADHANVTAILYGGVLGQESGAAIADLLYGAANPSGKLTYTLAASEADYPGQICSDTDCDYDEGVLVDYRYFDAHNNLSVTYPFGHGLSYTTFAYGAVTVKQTDHTALASPYPTGKLALGGEADLWDEVIQVTVTVKNTGSRAGADTAQLYVTFPSEAGQPPRVLRGFEKVSVAPGKEVEVRFGVRRRDVSYWDTAAQKWAVARGEYTFWVGASSRDLRGSAKLAI
jgi:beta-glucosidase